MRSRQLLVDHVLIVSYDADSTAARIFERTGLASLPGGEHVGLGTRNQIVPLVMGFLEIVEVHDKSLARDNAFGRLGLAGLAAASAHGAEESMFNWSTVVADIAPVAERTGTECIALTREGVRALLCGVDEAAGEPCRPFFIQRGPMDTHPGLRPAAHAVDVIGFSRLAATASGRGPEMWLDEVPKGSTTFDLLAGGRPGLTRVEISVRGADPVVLTADQPTGIAR